MGLRGGHASTTHPIILRLPLAIPLRKFLPLGFINDKEWK